MQIRAADPLYDSLLREYHRSKKPGHVTYAGIRYMVVTDNDELYFVKVSTDSIDDRYNQNSLR